MVNMILNQKLLKISNSGGGAKYDALNLDHLISQRLAITRGGSMLRGAKELASKVFEKQVRIDKPHIIPVCILPL